MRTRKNVGNMASSWTFSVGFIGGGHLTQAMLAGLSCACPESMRAIWVVEPRPAVREQLVHLYGVTVYESVIAVVKAADLVVVAVKPQRILPFLQAVAARHWDTLVVSVAAGVRLADLKTVLASHRVVRAMPNIAARVGQSATGLYTNQRLTVAERETLELFFAALGFYRWLDTEDHLDQLTVVASSGIAYMLVMWEMWLHAAVAIGLPAEIAKDFIVPTCAGAVALTQETQLAFEVLRCAVTSPGGTTEQALTVLGSPAMKQAWLEALSRAHHRSTDLAQAFLEQLQKSCSVPCDVAEK